MRCAFDGFMSDSDFVKLQEMNNFEIQSNKLSFKI